MSSTMTETHCLAPTGIKKSKNVRWRQPAVCALSFKGARRLDNSGVYARVSKRWSKHVSMAGATRPLIATPSSVGVLRDELERAAEAARVYVDRPKECAYQPVASATSEPVAVVGKPVSLLEMSHIANTEGAGNGQNGQDWFAEGEVTPIFSWCCGYNALLPSVATTCSTGVLCANCFTGACIRGEEGCVCFHHKDWLTLTGCTLYKSACNLLCCASVCAFPCQKDIPCRLTICYWTLCGKGGCGCCKKADFGKALMGTRGSRSTKKSSVMPTGMSMER